MKIWNSQLFFIYLPKKTWNTWKKKSIMKNAQII